MKKTVLTSLIILMLSLSVFPVKPVEAQPSTGSISFQPNETPNIGFDYNVQEYQFELTWKQFYLNFKPFAIYNGERLEFEQIIPWIKNNYPNVDYRWAVQKFRNYHRWGYWLEKLPQNVADNLDYLGFDVSDTNIPLNKVEIEEIPDVNFTFKKIILGNRLTLDFYELYERGFEVSINKTMILIGKVKGKTDLDLDPIVYGAPTITVTGFTSGTPCTFWDIWNASNVLGWNVVNNTCNTQFKFWAFLMIGDGSTLTWFADVEKQYVFADGVATGHWGNIIWVRTNATFRLGELMDATSQTGGRGVSFINLDSSWHTYGIRGTDGTVQLYGSTFISTEQFDDCRIMMNDLEPIYNCIFEYVRLVYANVTINRVTFNNPYQAAMGGTGDMNDLLITETSDGGVGALSFSTNQNATITNFIGRNNNFIARMSGMTTGTLYLIDADDDAWHINFLGVSHATPLWRQNTFNLNVVDQYGVPLDDVDVLLTYSGQGETEIAYMGSTPASGAIPEQIITKGFYNHTGGDVIFPFEPYELRVSKLDYRTNIVVFNFSNPINWTIPLMAEPSRAQGGELIAILILIPMIGVLIWGVKRR